jgi:hypothetical protein
MKATEREYEFTLILSGIPDLTSDVTSALFEAGCDDATPSMCQGRAYLDFTRTAPSFEDAILSAIDNVRRAGIGAEVLRIDSCDLVTQSEIAQRIDRSRQQVHQYVTGERGPGGFPPPACRMSEEQDSRLWDWREVASWLYQNNLIPESTVRDATVIALVNSALELHQQQAVRPKLVKEVLDRIGISSPASPSKSKSHRNSSRLKAGKS